MARANRQKSTDFPRQLRKWRRRPLGKFWQVKCCRAKMDGRKGNSFRAFKCYWISFPSLLDKATCSPPGTPLRNRFHWNQFECIKHPLTRLFRVPWKATKIRIQAHSTQVPYCVWDSSPHTHMATTQKKRSLLSVHANFFPVALQLDLLFESLASGCLHMPTHQRTPLHQQGIALSFHCCQSLI